MASYTRLSLTLLTSAAALALGSCGGADSVASPGAGTVVINPPAPAPAPTPAPTATPITAAQFAAATTVNTITVTADEQLALVNAGSNNNVNGQGSMLNGIYPTSATSLRPARIRARAVSSACAPVAHAAYDVATRAPFQPSACAKVAPATYPP